MKRLKFHSFISLLLALILFLWSGSLFETNLLSAKTKKKTTKIVSSKKNNSKKISKSKKTVSKKKPAGKKLKSTEKKAKATVPSHKGGSVKSQESELEEINRTIKETEIKLNTLGKKEKVTLNNINTNKKVSIQLSQYIGKLVSTINVLQDQLEFLKTTYRSLDNRQKKTQSAYSEFSAGIQIPPSVSTAELIIMNKPLESEIERQNATECVTSMLNQITTSIAVKMDSIEHRTHILEDVTNEQLYIKNKKEKENKQIKQSIASNQKLLTKIKTDKEALKKLLAEKQRSAKKIRSMIAELVKKEMQQKQKPVEKKTTPKTDLASKTDKKTTPTVTPKSKVKDDDYVPPPKIIGSIGKIIWPISSRKILRHYGENRNSETNTIFDNPGIDIAASPGTGVVAAANGTVSLINWLPGYGQLVIINHGNGFRSVYANLSSVSVRKGDEVRQGKSVGRTGHSVDGDFLHFELWTGTSRMNPASYLH